MSWDLSLGVWITNVYHSASLEKGVSKCSIVCVDKKNQLDVTFVFFISLLLVAQHVSGNHVLIIRS